MNWILTHRGFKIVEGIQAASTVHVHCPPLHTHRGHKAMMCF